MCLLLGLSLLLPEVIVACIGDLDGHTLYWSIQAYLLVAGVALLFVRYPFAGKGKRMTIQMMHELERTWGCS